MVGQAVPPARISLMAEYRRRLPHFHPHDAFVFLTWRLAGTLPFVVDRKTYSTPGHVFVAADSALDECSFGPRWLADTRIADLIATAIQIGEAERGFYELCAWVVMPNHVHLLILPRRPVPVIMRWLKGSTARRANQLLRRTGSPFWQDESYDHWVRNGKELSRITRYIEENPVTAAFVPSAELWRWSSASRQAKPPAPPSCTNRAHG
jgi:putative transposase